MNIRVPNLIVSSLLMIAVASGVAASPTCVVPPSGLVSWWPVDDNPGRTSDIKGSHHGSAQGSGYASGKVGEYAFSFAGADGNHVLIPNDVALEPYTGVTVDAWVRADGSPGLHRYLLAKGADGCTAASFGLYTGSGGGLQFYVYDGSEYYLSPAAGLTVWDGSWHFVAATYDPPLDDPEGAPGIIRLYVDGVEIGEGMAVNRAVEYGLPQRDLSIGDYLGCLLPFQGDIDEVELFQRALGLSEIQALYAADSAGKCQRKVTIDIKPGSDPNSVNLSSAGVIPVAILSDESFDATLLDPFSIDLNGAMVKLVGNKIEKPLCHAEDANGDGLVDLVCQVYTVDYIVELGQAVAVLKAQTLDGQWIYGEDLVNVVPD